MKVKRSFRKVEIALGGAVFGLVMLARGASGLGYQNSVGVEFTFEPVLAINLSSNALIIPNLTPGSSAYSNTITINVATNNIAGYTLSAKVGDGTTYTNDKLTNATSSTVFNNLSSSSNLTLSQFNDNDWGYALGTISGSTTYSGLVYNTDTVINATTNNTGTAASSGCVSTCSGTNTTNFTIAAKASSTQASGDYSNVIIFTVVGNRPPEYLYDKVAELSRGTLAQNSISLTDAITTPTSTNKATDTSNSGVFVYDATLRGAASDASNDHTIYFYRGVLETDPGDYGSAGSANAYPNYVKLSNNTCWRIVRTTGSGGVKMIYNGTWTGSTCANSSSSTELTDLSFASQGTSINSTWYYNMAYVGYTFNNDVTDSTTNTPLSTILGSDTHPEYNNTRSNIKTYIEKTWYAKNMKAYTNKLEASAGYCADRTVYNTSNVLQSESTETLPYSEPTPFESLTTYYFGASVRITGGVPSYTCPRSTVDLYHYVVGSTGTSNELKYPVALLTADEAALAGSGWGASSTNYSAQSFLVSGLSFWLLSPFTRNSGGFASVFILDRRGKPVTDSDIGAQSTNGVRPVISLIPGTLISGGSGTATDPWTVD